jgi:GntR family transcriptional regulator
MTSSVLTKLREGTTPLYAQITGLMKRRIQSGEWPPGTALPTLNELAAQFGVARVTVRQAMDVLAAERLIWRRQGKGTFVTEHGRDKHWLSVETDWKSLVRMIEGTESHVLNAFDTIRSPRLESADGNAAETYHYMRRLHSYQGRSHLLIDLYLDRKVYLRARKKFDQLPVIPVMDRLPGLKLGPARQTLTVSTADIEIAELLHMAVGEPIVEVRRVIQDATGKVIYFANLHYKADAFRLEMHLRN